MDKKMLKEYKNLERGYERFVKKYRALLTVAKGLSEILKVVLEDLEKQGDVGEVKKSYSNVSEKIKIIEKW